MADSAGYHQATVGMAVAGVALRVTVPAVSGLPVKASTVALVVLRAAEAVVPQEPVKLTPVED